MNLKLTLSIVLAIIVFTFIFQNTTVVEFRFLLWTISMSRSLMFFLLLGIGMAIGWLLNSHLYAKRERN